MGTEMAATISLLHPDLLNRVLYRLDGTSVASMSCAAPEFRALAEDQSLWQRFVTETWPAMANSDVKSLVASFPGGFCSFYADSYPLVSPSAPLPPPMGQMPAEMDLVSIVDIRYRGDIILSKVIPGIGLQDPSIDWFIDSPFRLHALEQKDDPPAIVRGGRDYTGEETRRLLTDGIEMSWVVVDVKRGRSVCLTGRTPLEVEHHWYSEMEYRVNFGTILPLERGLIYCGVSVKCGSYERGELKVREVTMTMEDTEGNVLSGREFLVILQRALAAKRRKGGEWLNGQYEEFLRIKREIKESSARREKRADLAFVVSGIITLCIAFVVFILTRR